MQQKAERSSGGGHQLDLYWSVSGEGGQPDGGPRADALAQLLIQPVGGDVAHLGVGGVVGRGVEIDGERQDLYDPSFRVFCAAVSVGGRLNDRFPVVVQGRSGVILPDISSTPFCGVIPAVKIRSPWRTAGLYLPWGMGFWLIRNTSIIL